jgi:hypothetical protein
MYKIVICCENNGKQLLTFNDKSIDTKKYPTIRKDIDTYLKGGQIPFIKHINILHKDFVEETEYYYRTVSIKKIEFVCNQFINEYQLELFIEYLKLIGFDSCSYANAVKYFENDKLIFNYNFNDIVKQNAYKRDSIILSKKYKTQLVV